MYMYTLLGVVFLNKNRRLTLLFVFLGTCCVFCVWGVVVFFECCDALLAAFQQAIVFNSDLSKWETGGVTEMLQSKCTLLGVVLFFQEKKLRKFQKNESDPPTTICVCSFSSCIDLFPLIQSF